MTVTPGGGLVDLELTEFATRRDADDLAAAILLAVDKATAEANALALHSLGPLVVGLSDVDLQRLGIGQDAELTDAAESTTPDTWQVAP